MSAPLGTPVRWSRAGGGGIGASLAASASDASVASSQQLACGGGSDDSDGAASGSGGGGGGGALDSHDSRDGGSSGGSLRLAELEARYERELSEKVNAALGAHLGPENYRVSVTAKLNSDSRRTDETIYFPESRVERSVRTVREEGNQSNSSNAEPMTVTENIPEEETPSASGETSSENREKREETANYEISQKKVMTVSEGYVVDRLNIALVVSRARMAELLGEEATDERIDAAVADAVQRATQACGARLRA